MLNEDAFRQAISSEIPNWSLEDLLGSLRDQSPLRDEFSAYVCRAVFLRCLFLMLPDIEPEQSYNIRKKIVSKFLETHFTTVTDETVEFVIELTAKLSAAKRGFRKDGWGDLHFSTRSEILSSQGNRCRTCGVVLDLSGDATSVSSPQLDHVLPFGLGGNEPENLIVICKGCNVIKSDDVSVVTTDSVDINYFLKGRKQGYSRRVKFWVHVRDDYHCTIDGCHNHAGNAQLEVRRKFSSGRSVYDNLSTVCEHCLDGK